MFPLVQHRYWRTAGHGTEVLRGTSGHGTGGMCGTAGHGNRGYVWDIGHELVLADQASRVQCGGEYDVGRPRVHASCRGSRDRYMLFISTSFVFMRFKSIYWER